MASSSSTFVLVPNTQEFKEITSDETKQIVETKQNKAHLLTLSTVKWQHSIEDEQLAKILQEEYNKENVHKPSINENISYTISSSNTDHETAEAETYWDNLDPFLEESDKALTYKSKSKHNVIKSKKCKHIIPGVDPKAKLVLNNMIEKGVFDKIDVILFKGREFTILRATKKISVSPYDIKTKIYAIKVFQTRQIIINWTYDSAKHEYIRSETYSHSTHLKLARSKAEKEMIYYQRLKKAGVPCPDVIALKQHILVLSMVGDNSPAPLLKHAQFQKMKTTIAYEQVMQYMKILYEQCNLIHGNLSEKNILWFDSSCYFINLAQALEPHEINAYHFLFDDCKNVCKFFKKLKVPNVTTPERLFLDITGYNYAYQAILDEVQRIKRENHIRMSSHNKV